MPDEPNPVDVTTTVNVTKSDVGSDSVNVTKSQSVDVNLADLDPFVPAKSWVWMKDASGHSSVTVTLVAVSFWVTTIAFVLSFFEKIGPLAIRPFDMGATAAYFGPILAMYVGRKYTDAKFGINQNKGS